MSPKITIVGGGSTHWTPTLMVDFANTPSLHGAQLTLHDLDASSLPPMLDLARYIASVRKIEMKAQAAADLDAALIDAEYVITTFSVGGFASMRHDIEIPARYGIRQPVGDSVGPGGIMRSLRSVPVIVAIAQAVERVAPKAMLINVSNPLSALCRSVVRQTAVTTVGLCNELVGLKFVLSLLFDCAMHEVDPVVGGVNHLPLVTDLRIAGGDGMSMLRDLLESPGKRVTESIWMDPPEGMHWRKVSSGSKWTKADVVANNRIKFELFTRFGVLPGSADTHVSEFFPGFVTDASDFGREWGVHHYGMAGHKSDKMDDDAVLVALLRGGEISTYPSGELVAELLDAMVRGVDHEIPVNLPNTGQLDSIPEGSIVECIGTANGDGVRARDIVNVPSVLGEYLRRIAHSQELTVEAAFTGNRTTVLEAMLSDQLAGRLPYEQVVGLTDEMLLALSPWLPQFSKAT